jgi:hypothetical protein
MKNTIMHDNTDYEIFMQVDTVLGDIFDLYIVYCDIQDGLSGIYNQSNTHNINWGEGNIDGNPQFLLSGANPFQLTEYSPCIDTGTPDTTGLFLPPWDLLYHDRIWDGDSNGEAIIDMGCYEFGADSVGVSQHLIPKTQNYLTNYPNPFNPSTTISFDLNNVLNGQYELSIYNLKGQKVRSYPINSLTHQPINSVIWNGNDENNKSVASGIYFAKLKIGDQTLSRKLLLIK